MLEGGESNDQGVQASELGSLSLWQIEKVSIFGVINQRDPIM